MVILFVPLRFQMSISGNLDALASCQCEKSKEISMYVLPCFRLTPIASGSIPNIPFTWNSMENDDYCSESHNSGCGIFHMEKKFFNVNMC